ncbi:MAG: hypothetical protein JKP97_21175 [Rhodobacteraceae bacterium]|jgi:hypothetical protein|nr:hypothetical protein [Paracoccaceae bacterium]
MSNRGAISANYYLMHKSDALLDRTGRERLEIQQSDLIEVELPSRDPIGKRKELRYDPSASNPHLWFKRGTKPFQVHYMAMENALIADAKWGQQLDPRDLLHATEVTAQFPRTARPYIFANLALYETYATHVIYPKSRFYSGDYSYLHIHKTRIGRGEEPFDTLPDRPITQRELSDSDDYWALRLAIRGNNDGVFPETLCLSLDRLPSIFNFATHQTLFREDLALPLRTAKNPGLWFPGPPVRVELG